MLLDPDMSEEVYIEDCQVCCNPIEIYFKIKHLFGIFQQKFN